MGKKEDDELVNDLFDSKDEALIKNKLQAAVMTGQGPRLLEIALRTQNSKLLKQLLGLKSSKIFSGLKLVKVVDYLMKPVKAGAPDPYSLLETFFVRLTKNQKQKILNEFKKRNIDLVYESAKYGNGKLLNSLHLMGENLAARYNSQQDNLFEASVLHVAAKYNHPRVIEYLIKNGLDSNVLDLYNQTPLLFAVDKGHKASVESLIKQGADASIPNVYGETPLKVAQSRSNEEMVKLIQADMHREKREQANNLIQDVRFIKKIGHALGLRAAIELEVGSQGKRAAISTEAGPPLHSLENLLEYVDGYFKHIDSSSDAISDFKTIQEALTFTTGYMRFDGSHTAEEMAARYRAGKLAFVSSGWEHHATAEVFYKDSVVDSNRGEGMGVTGTLIRKIPDQAKVTAEYIRGLKLLGPGQTQFQNRTHLAKAVDINSYEQALPTKKQKWGTCTFVNPKASIMGILYLLKLEQLTSQQPPPQAGLLLGALDAKQQAEFKKQALDYAHREYKKFTSFIRQAALEELRKNFYSVSASPARKDLAFKLLFAYIHLHHGQPRIDGKPRLAKRNSEILRLKYIFQNMPEQDNKTLLELLGKSNLLLFEIASRYHDTDYSELLANQWPVDIHDVLNQRDVQGMTALIRTVIMDTVKELEYYMKIENAAEWLNAQEPRYGQTALHAAIHRKDLKKIEMLANHPEIDLSLKDLNGMTPFALAVSLSNAEIMKIISSAEEKQRQAKADSFKP